MQYYLERLQFAIKAILRNPATFFLFTAAVFGIVICFRLPPLNGTDEFTHFPRVYQITDGTLWEQKMPHQQYGGQIPFNVSSMVDDYRDLSRKSNPQEYASRTKQLNAYYSSQSKPGEPVGAIYTSVAIYPPWSYAPSAIGLVVAKVLNTPLIWYVYLARLSSLLVWIVLVWWAIRLLPSGKWFLTVLALLPTSLSQATTIGGDGLLTGLSWLTIALVIAVFANKVNLNWIWLTLLGLASLYLAVIKAGYWLISLLPLIIPAYFFKSRKVAVAWKTVLAALVIVSSIFFAYHNMTTARYATLTPRLGVYIDSNLQQQYVLHHPLLFLVRAFGQFFTKSYDTIYLGIVGILTNRLIYLPLLVIGLLYVTLFLALKQSKRLPVLAKHRQLLLLTFLSAFVGTCIFISLAFYIGNTQVGSDTIFGIYGRYYLPILPLLLIIPLAKRKGITAEHALVVLPILSVIGLVYTAIAISQ